MEYEPGLPLPNSKLIIWLFLSTEIMFFAGLIGTYIVLRFGAPVWPYVHEVHISEPVGAFNTFVLICSSVTIVLALEASRANKAGLAKGLVFLTFLLGSVFLGVKAYEYSAKFAHGIYPAMPQNRRLYDKADIYYASAVRQRLTDLAATISGLEKAKGATLTDAEKDARARSSGRNRHFEVVKSTKTKKVPWPNSTSWATLRRVR